MLRGEDPDKTVPGRIWTTELGLAQRAGASPIFTLRLVASSTEESLDIEPHVPGVVLQLITSPGLASGNFQRLSNHPVIINSAHSAELLIEALLDPSRKLPVVVMSVPAGSSDVKKPLLDADTLAKSCAGLALVIILPAEFSWILTERFGKQLSVYEGAVRVYLPGFTEDANPFGGHELVLPKWFTSPAHGAFALTRLRWIVAKGSVRRLQIGSDVLSFAAYRVKLLEQRQRDLLITGASKKSNLRPPKSALFS